MERSKGSLTMSHGAGGAVMQDMIGKLIVPILSNKKWKRSKIQVPLDALDDSAVVDGIVFTTDSHTVRPIFFPGGDIGSLSVAGTVNDLSVVGAEPLALSCGFVLEEGLAFEELERILRSMAATCKKAGVPVVTGDTKVVERGAVQKIIINTSGIGRRSPLLDGNLRVARRYRKVGSNWLLDSNLRPGDTLILSGVVGDHGIAVLSQREGYGFESVIKSDVAPLNAMVASGLKAGGVVACKDPTRGGLANLLNEWAGKSRTGIVIEEEAVPIHDGVRTACEMLGIDPLSIGNEGKAVFGVVRERAEEVLKALRRTREGRHAAIIGEATTDVKGVVLHTTVGGKRILEQPAGDPIPRIC